MGRHAKPADPLFKDIDGPILVGIGNWLVESLDASELKNEQVLLLYLVIDCCMDVLWREFPELIVPFVLRTIERLDLDDE